VKKLTFQQKMWLPLISSLVCITAIFVFDAIQTRNVRIEERTNDLSNIEEVALKTVKYYGELAQAGTLTKEQAQQQAITAIRNFRFGSNGVTLIDGTVVANPGNPSVEGTNLIDFKDANGVYLYREIAAAAKTEAGTGFIRYVYPRPGETKPIPKLTKVVSYKQWDWALTSGVYMDDIDNAFEQSLERSSAMLVGVCILLALIVAAINRSLRKAIGGAPEYAAQVAESIAENDLRTSVVIAQDDRHSMLFAMKAMQENLVKAVAEIRGSAENIASASSQIASGSMDLSTRTESQASSLEETAASMEELTSTVRQNADNAHEANALAETAYSAAEQTNLVVSKLVENMSDIDAKATKIGDIIGVIDSIAFQTNILALNAAVEAARAGEQGRGFAVVATEVRNLAKRSADAAREVKTVIKDADDTVRAGVQLTSDVGKNMHEIMDRAKRLSSIIAEISSASREQASGIEQVTVAVSHMDDATQKNAALVEELAAAANHMQDQAGQLLQLVSMFRLHDSAAPAPRMSVASGDFSGEKVGKRAQLSITTTPRRPPSLAA